MSKTFFGGAGLSKSRKRSSSASPTSPAALSSPVVARRRKSRRVGAGLLSLDCMALMAILRALLRGVLRAAAAHHMLEGEDAPIGLADQLVGAARVDARVPERLALVGHQDRVAYVELSDEVQIRQPE